MILLGLFLKPSASLNSHGLQVSKPPTGAPAARKAVELSEGQFTLLAVAVESDREMLATSFDRIASAPTRYLSAMLMALATSVALGVPVARAAAPDSLGLAQHAAEEFWAMLPV